MKSCLGLAPAANKLINSADSERDICRLPYVMSCHSNAIEIRIEDFLFVSCFSTANFRPVTLTDRRVPKLVRIWRRRRRWRTRCVRIDANFPTWRQCFFRTSVCHPISALIGKRTQFCLTVVRRMTQAIDTKSFYLHSRVKVAIKRKRKLWVSFSRSLTFSLTCFALRKLFVTRSEHEQRDRIDLQIWYDSEAGGGFWFHIKFANNIIGWRVVKFVWSS